jgi:hypothetical protein
MRGKHEALPLRIIGGFSGCENDDIVDRDLESVGAGLCH